MIVFLHNWHRSRLIQLIHKKDLDHLYPFHNLCLHPNKNSDWATKIQTAQQRYGLRNKVTYCTTKIQTAQQRYIQRNKDLLYLTCSSALFFWSWHWSTWPCTRCHRSCCSRRTPRPGCSRTCTLTHQFKGTVQQEIARHSRKKFEIWLVYFLNGQKKQEQAGKNSESKKSIKI